MVFSGTVTILQFLQHSSSNLCQLYHRSGEDMRSGRSCYSTEWSYQGRQIRSSACQYWSNKNGSMSIIAEIAFRAVFEVVAIGMTQLLVAAFTSSSDERPPGTGRRSGRGCNGKKKKCADTSNESSIAQPHVGATFPRYIIHQRAKGETIEELATVYEVSAAKIMIANGLRTRDIDHLTLVLIPIPTPETTKGSCE